MVNRILYWFLRPEKGWDPITKDYCNQYADNLWEKMNNVSKMVDYIEKNIGSLNGKKVLDLGAGPGTFSLEFQRRGGKVVWFDISKNYLNYARRKHLEYNLEIQYELGYLEDSIKLNKQFDFVFNRNTWYYCMNDYKYGKLLYNLLTDGGSAYIIARINSGINKNNYFQRILVYINEKIKIKIGHPHPSSKRVLEVINNSRFKHIKYIIEKDHIKCWLKK